MPEKKTIDRARKDRRAGKSASTQAGEFVRETMEHIREGRHGARSAKQAIAIGLSKARRAGVKLPAPKKGTVPEKTRQHALRDAARPAHRRVSARHSRAVTSALKREGTAAASHRALSKQAHAAALRRGKTGRKRAARKAVQTKGKAPLHRAAIRAAHTGAAHEHASWT